jgi:biotin carboxylase
MDKKSILIFGLGPLQQSIIERCKLKGLFTIGIDPSRNASCKNLVNVFEIVDGQDFEGTLNIAKKYNVLGIITSATDKPLIMMARVAKVLDLPFFSIDTAECSTDKLLMKLRFQENAIPCAKGFILNNIEELINISFKYPVIVKPRDNSGSRGVIFCRSDVEINYALGEALKYTKKGNVLIEEFIEGKEYSVESLHYNGKTHVIQITEKITTDFPYNVEMGHIQPAEIIKKKQYKIYSLITKIAKALKFDNCGSHTELKINSNGIIIIETSPRLGGDFISSTLVPLSSGINMEDILIDISLGNKLEKDCFSQKFNKSSGIIYFQLPEGEILNILNINMLEQINGIQSYLFELKAGDKVNQITSSLNRYGYAIFQNNEKSTLITNMETSQTILNNNVIIKKK